MGAVLVWSVATGAVDFPLTWRWSNPRPHGNNIIDMAQSGAFWIQVAERGQIYTSGDLRRWMPRDSGTTKSLRSVAFFNQQIVISGEAGTILFGDSAANLKLISLGTDDWLESVTASPELMVAVGDNAAVYTSSNGTDWKRQRAPFTNWLRSVAFGTPLGAGVFVTVGESGLVAASVDGQNWQRGSSGTTQDLNKVAWVDGQFWAVGSGGEVLISAAGTVWQPAQNTGATNTLNTIASSPSSKLIAGDNEVRLQEEQTAWANELDPTNLLPPPAWTYLSALWTGDEYLMAGRTGIMVEGFKTNSTSSPTFWLPVADSVRDWLWDTERFSSVYLTVGDRATILSSINGVDWQQELPPESAVNAIFLGVGGRTNLAVAVGSGGTIIYSQEEFRAILSTNANNVVVTNQVSTLGIVWQAAQSPPTTADLQGITAFGDSFVVTGGSGTVLTSADAVAWTMRTAPTPKFLSSVESFPGGVVAVGDDGTIVTSLDAIDWTSRVSGTTNWLYRVRYLGGKLIAVGQNGTILTSGDGVAWTQQDSGTSRWLNDVEWIDNTYFAIGNQGTVLTSTNGTQWTDRGTITAKSLFGAAAHNGRLIAVGIEGVILRTRVMPASAPIRFVDFPHNANQNLFLLSGEIDQRFTLDRSTNLLNWSRGPTLEISEESRTLLYLDTGANALDAQYFRATPVR